LNSDCERLRTQKTTSNQIIFDKISGHHLCGHLVFLIYSESTLIVLFWADRLQFLFSFTNISFSFFICFLITACDKGNFGKGCRNTCHCLNGVGCNNVNGECPCGNCDAGWKPNTCYEGKLFLLSYNILCYINRMVNGSEHDEKST
jgi:hypothetical protein